MSNIMIKLGNLDMLRSMYDFRATYAKTLSFKANDYFILHQTNTKHKNWWEVMNQRGEMGFIPSNYVSKVTVSPAFYLQYLDHCIDYVKRHDMSLEYAVGDKKELLLRLKEMKRQIEDLPEVSDNSVGGESGPPLLFRTTDGHLESVKGNVSKCSSNSSSLSSDIKRNDMLEEPIKPIHKMGTSRDSLKKSMENIHEIYVREHRRKSDTNTHNVHSNSSFSSKVSPIITHQSVYDLVENVRINTKLSHEMSRVALVTVVQGLHELLPASVFPYLSTILSHSQQSLSLDKVQIDQTHDASRLKIIFNELTSCKEDSQQRSWMLHEDESVIKEYLNELISILSNADGSITKHVVSKQDYLVINTLIQYYQMEVRWSIRQLLLQAFGILCSLDKTVMTIMLNSVLPGEIARDMITSPRNAAKLNFSSLLLTMIFSMGEPMPVTHFEYLGAPFISFILGNIEYPPDTDVDEQIPDLFLHFLLAYNLQFTCLNDNVLIKVLSEKQVAKIFTEKILLLLNREEDPVRIFDHQPAPPHSLLKLFNDLFGNEDTGNLFYTNDIKVLIDIIVRNMLDLSPGDKKRRRYLELCRRVMRNTSYEEHLHRKEDILKCFTRIFCEESDQSRRDQKLVREIMNEFPRYFK